MSWILIAVAFSANAAQLSNEEGMRFARDYLKEHGLDATVELQIQEVQKNLPIKSSPLESTVSVTYLKISKTQIFRHATAPDWRQQAARIGGLTPQKAEAEMPKRLQQQTVNNACSVPFTRLLLENGLTIKHVYYEADGKFLFQTEVSSKNCTGQ